MSLFRVRLSNIAQGQQDRDPYQKQMPVSIQRGVYVKGPYTGYHQLMDGQVFFEETDYWKQFAYPQVPFQDAFIDVLGDSHNVVNNFTFSTGRLWRGQILDSPPVVFDVTGGTRLSITASADDFSVMMPIDQKITATYDANKNYVYTLSTRKYIIFNNTTGWFIPGPGSITITDGVNKFYDVGTNFVVSDIRTAGFKTRNWSDGLLIEELKNWGVIDPSGKAYFKFVFFGDSGGIDITGITAS